MIVELLVVANPDPDSRLPYLIRLPLGGGLVFATSDTWPRTKGLYCHRLDIADWPAEPVIVDRVALNSCTRRGAAIDVVAAEVFAPSAQPSSAELRAWATDNGFAVSDRGRVPKTVLQAWHEAHRR